MDVNILLSRLDKVRASGSGRWVACCPAHEDRSPSLQISEVDNRILIHCFAGCGATEVLNAINLDYSAIYPDDYEPSTRVIQIDPVDKIYIMIYKSKIRSGEMPTPEDRERYIRIIGEMYD